MSISHWAFWVTRPRLDVRLRNRLVDSSGSLPARSFARTDQEEPRQDQTHRAAIRPTISQTLLSAARMPMTTRTRPTAESTAPRDVERPGRVGRQRVRDAAAQHHDHHDDQRLEDEGGPPADRRRDQAADQRAGGRPDAAHRADHSEGPRPRRHIREHIVARM